MDVCVNVSNAEQIPVGGAEIEVSVTNQGVNPATRKPQEINQMKNDAYLTPFYLF